jgi:hypothetical protein
MKNHYWGSFICSFCFIQEDRELTLQTLAMVQ